MKIYNKKGLIIGIISFVIAALSLFTSLFLEKNISIKTLVLPIIMLICGFTNIKDAFSKNRTLENKINENDERNQLIKLKSQTMSHKIFSNITITIAILFLLLYFINRNISFLNIFIVASIIWSIINIIDIFTYFYYEKKE
ncbi:hypothetical protein BG261_02625 [Floricoccus tropicus]|uniref:DUF2178 domain-containing protein n=1 Tax=Floricoccus tropicus TaxID=1859473 RepID=A0A1E8GMN2_9LACT|nr:hypothetical protein [Floricoccus tropicus]OFI49492.1 hypothetical protein BG261_02625 [Floricoccus tropicus]